MTTVTLLSQLLSVFALAWFVGYELGRRQARVRFARERADEAAALLGDPDAQMRVAIRKLLLFAGKRGFLW